MFGTILTFLVVLGILIFAHEFGHFIVARLSGVGVLTFSLGFGPKLFSRKVGETEYCLSAFPLGGYVRLLGDDPKEEIEPEQLQRSFLTQGVGKKIAIVAAGPIFNFILAFLIFSIFFMVGTPALTSDIGEVVEDSPAARAGIQSNDRVVAVDGEPIQFWEQVEESVEASNGRSLQMTLLRDGREVTVKIIPMMQESQNIFGDLQKGWTLGIRPKVTTRIGSIQQGSPADHSDLRPGDVIVAVGERRITHWEEIRESIQFYGGQEIVIGVMRSGEPVEVRVTPTSNEGGNGGAWKVGIFPTPSQTVRRFDPVTAVVRGAERTYFLTQLNLIALGKLIQGKIPAKDIGGPILIAQMTGQRSEEGWSSILQFLALLSINLGIINLFPIPILDGGHLLLFGIEAVLGRPLSMRIREVAQQIGLFVIISLMIFAFYNDLMRLYDDLIRRLGRY